MDMQNRNRLMDVENKVAVSSGRREERAANKVYGINRCKLLDMQWKWVLVADSLRPYGLNLPGSSVHENFQARIFPWVAVSSFGGSADPGIKPTEPLHQYKFLGQIRELKLGLLPQLSFLESSSKFRFW